MRSSRTSRHVRLAVAVGVLSGLALIPTVRVAVASCGSLSIAARWPMDEVPGATTMHDTAGSNDGSIAYAQTGLSTPAHQGFGTFYRFGRGPEFPKGSQVSVPDAAALDPGSCDFAVDVWVNWDNVAPQDHATYNVTQKGLATAVSNWKMEVDGRPGSFGRVICTFDGIDSSKPVRVSTPAGVTVPAGVWTELRCERQGNRFIAGINGQQGSLTVSNIGPITNSSALTVGAKKLNDSDTFPGDVDELVFWEG